MTIKFSAIYAAVLICIFLQVSCARFTKRELSEKHLDYSQQPAVIVTVKPMYEEPKPDIIEFELKHPEPVDEKEIPVTSNPQLVTRNSQLVTSNSQPELKEPQCSFNVGEKVTYDVTLWKMKNTFGFNKGSVIFEVSREVFDSKNCHVFTATAEGEGFGYKLKMNSVSYINSDTFLPVLTSNIQSGSENREKKTQFYDDKIEYSKKKHCKLDDSCEDTSHYINLNGIRSHCRKCQDANHYTWTTRFVHENVKPTYDLLSGLYIARQFPLSIGGKVENIRLVDGRDLWQMSIQAIAEEVIETEIGKFDTLELKLTATPLNEHAKEQKSFTGLFGLKGDMALWVDKESKIPIRIRGAYPLVFDVQIEILIKTIRLKAED